MALDYGSARCGAALSDPTGVLATPLDPVLSAATRKGFGQIAELVSENEVEMVVVGLPLSLDGHDSAQTTEARGFAKSLSKRLGTVPVELFDERFTTRMAQRDGDGRAQASEDSRAAAHLLTAWLDAHRESE